MTALIQLKNLEKAYVWLAANTSCFAVFLWRFSRASS